MLIGEFGQHPYMTIDDAKLMMQVAEENDVPWIAWGFHQRCDPNLLEDSGGARLRRLWLQWGWHHLHLAPD